MEERILLDIGHENRDSRGCPDGGSVNVERPG
jgi:hypothetical protein